MNGPGLDRGVAEDRKSEVRRREEREFAGRSHSHIALKRGRSSIALSMVTVSTTAGESAKEGGDRNLPE